MSNLEKVVLNRGGVNKLLRDAATREMIAGQADSMLARLGDGYSVNVNYSSKDGRVTAYVHPANEQTEQDNLENNTILKSAGGGND